MMSFVPIELQGLDQWLGCIIGVALGLMVQGEGQAFFVLMFQPIAERQKMEYDLNPLHHIDARALPVILLTGWGWGKKRIAEPPYFPQAWIYRSLIPLTAPVANLCLVGVIGSVSLFIPSNILEIAMEVNILMAMANLLIPIPPMALGRALCCPFDRLAAHQTMIELLGATVLTVIIALEYWTKSALLQTWIFHASEGIINWVLNR